MSRHEKTERKTNPRASWYVRKERIVPPDKSLNGRRKQLRKEIEVESFRITTWTGLKGSEFDTNGRAESIITRATRALERLKDQLKHLS